VRECIEALVRDTGYRPLAFKSAEAFLSWPRTCWPSCLVLDITLPGLSGLDLQQRIAREQAEMPVIFVTGHDHIPTTVRAMKAGAVEFLVKPFGELELLEAIRSALQLSHARYRTACETKMLEGRYEMLSGREKEVMELVVSGFINKKIGAILGISEITVKAHRGGVMRKMMARSLAELVNSSTKLNISRQLDRPTTASIIDFQSTEDLLCGSRTAPQRRDIEI
jgi:FixJ family two-component response regulator